jgi:PleD family two-component response regulator
LYAAAPRRLLGELIGGDEGRRLLNEATDWMTGLWNRQLKDAEVAALWNRGNGKQYPF